MITAIGLCMMLLAIFLALIDIETDGLPHWLVVFAVSLFYAGLGCLFSSLIVLLVRYAP